MPQGFPLLPDKGALAEVPEDLRWRDLGMKVPGLGVQVCKGMASQGPESWTAAPVRVFRAWLSPSLMWGGSFPWDLPGKAL